MRARTSAPISSWPKRISIRVSASMRLRSASRTSARTASDCIAQLRTANSKRESNRLLSSQQSKTLSMASATVSA